MMINANRLVYTRTELLALKDNVIVGSRHLIPLEIRRKYRGCRAGRKQKAKLRVRAANRKRVRPPIPSVVMGNVNALSNKMDELTALIRNQRCYRECSLLHSL